MSNLNILSLLRSSSMPIHKKLDGIGISNFIKKGTFNQEIYLKWLVVTHQFLEGYKILLEESKHIHSGSIDFSPNSIGLKDLQQDIFNIQSDFILPKALRFPAIDHEDLMIVPIYTLLGSLMGSEIIYRYVIKNHPTFPVSYLENVLEQKSQWKNFKAHLEDFQLSAGSEDVSHYNHTFWTIIYDNYLDSFKSSGLKNFN